MRAKSAALIGSFEIIGSRNAFGGRSPSFTDEKIAKQLNVSQIFLFFATVTSSK